VGKYRDYWDTTYYGIVFQRNAKTRTKVIDLRFSYASAAPRNSFKKDLRDLLHNKNYIILFLGITCFFGDFSLFFVFLPWITKTYNFESISNGIIIISANLVGCIGCVIIGKLGNQLSYRAKSLILAPGVVVSLSLLWVSLEVNSPIMAYITGGLAGLFAYPLLTTMTDFATQTTFPVGEATASGILIFGGQIAGVILSVIFSFIFDG
jgi:predicted MFS family arabinose efflux permease